MGAVTEQTSLLFYTAGLFDWSVCELVCCVHENTAWTNRHWAIIPIWNDLNACSVISVCHSWGLTAVNLKKQTCLSDYDDVLFFLISPPFPFPRPYMCINSASQSYRIASRTQWRHSVTLNFFNGITSGKTYTCQNALDYPLERDVACPFYPPYSWTIYILSCLRPTLILSGLWCSLMRAFIWLLWTWALKGCHCYVSNCQLLNCDQLPATQLTPCTL